MPIESFRRRCDVADWPWIAWIRQHISKGCDEWLMGEELPEDAFARALVFVPSKPLPIECFRRRSDVGGYFEGSWGGTAGGQCCEQHRAVSNAIVLCVAGLEQCHCEQHRALTRYQTCCAVRSCT